MNDEHDLQLRARAIAAGLVLGALVGLVAGYIIGNIAAGVGTCMTVGAVATSIGARMKLKRQHKEGDAP
ncbi:hypothetical protein [Massilia sp. TS11]|uniref:hypothetical protein n=1 Tax=Massilia sp. TS11 TaxID=2908003 RepID=UPI001EDB9357|nr:hypothetical protein [Massilia sp. TS11]MCG2586228.1 hypothetical protein [Massilia sp. TS11]